MSASSELPETWNPDSIPDVDKAPERTVQENRVEVTERVLVVAEKDSTGFVK